MKEEEKNEQKISEETAENINDGTLADDSVEEEQLENSSDTTDNESSSYGHETELQEDAAAPQSDSDSNDEVSDNELRDELLEDPNPYLSEDTTKGENKGKIAIIYAIICVALAIIISVCVYAKNNGNPLDQNDIVRNTTITQINSITDLDGGLGDRLSDAFDMAINGETDADVLDRMGITHDDFKSFVKDGFQYEIKDIRIEGDDKAVVDTTFKSKKLVDLYNLAYSTAQEIDVSTLKSEDELYKQFGDKVKEKLEDIKPIESDINIVLKKEDGKWVIQNPEQLLSNIYFFE